MTEQRIYLDNNATTRPFPEVVDAMAACWRERFANPGSRHAEGRRARTALEDARESIAAMLGADPNEVVFTSGGTEAINLAIFGLTQTAAGTIALTAGEHPATVEACRSLRERGWRLHTLDVDAEGLLRPEQYDRLPWDDIKLATLILAHNETGVVQDVAPLAEHCREHGVPIHLDAVQAVGKVPVNFHDLGVTALSLGAHKFHGPRGMGALLLREGTRLAPHLFGGHQEAGRRPGTECVTLAAGMAKALEVWHAQRQQRGERLARLRDRLERGLAETCAPARVNGSRAHRLPNTLNVAFPGLDGDALLVAFDLEGIACSLGSTCASGSAEPAPALVAMGCPPEVYRSSVRFSLSIETTDAEIDEAVRRIAGVVGRLREQSN
ncbi:MAG: cysteine desulfurase family protein [Planctomycetaceae bacterium]